MFVWLHVCGPVFVNALMYSSIYISLACVCVRACAVVFQQRMTRILSVEWSMESYSPVYMCVYEYVCLL